ncbi:MAG: redoxin domain-containing protein [Polyangia bacterium]
MRCALLLGLLALVGCGGPKATPAPTIASDPGYPAGPYGYAKGDVLPDVQLEGKVVGPGLQAEWTDWQTLSFGALRTGGVRYFLIETAAAWCSDCAADQPAMMQLESDYRQKGVLGIELLVEGNFDAPASPDDLDQWSRDHGATGTLLLDAERAFERAADLVAIPNYFIVDAATMRMVTRSNDSLAGTPLGPALDSLLSK